MKKNRIFVDSLPRIIKPTYKTYMQIAQHEKGNHSNGLLSSIPCGGSDTALVGIQDPILVVRVLVGRPGNVLKY